MSLGTYRLTLLAKAPALYTGLQVSSLACSYYLEYPKLPFVSSTLPTASVLIHLSLCTIISTKLFLIAFSTYTQSVSYETDAIRGRPSLFVCIFAFVLAELLFLHLLFIFVCII